MTRNDHDETFTAGLGDRLRELSAEVALEATGRQAARWLTVLESLSEQADELEQARMALMREAMNG